MEIRPEASRLSRRTVLTAAAASAAGMSMRPSAAAAARSRWAHTAGCEDAWSHSLRQLDAKIRAAMRADGIPGVAVGVLLGRRAYVRGYGVTDVDHPHSVDGDTAFRIQSTTKTFTGMTMMRLVDQGKVDLDARVVCYLPDFATADKRASAVVTVRQLLNHTPGWLGDDFQGFGQGEDALARYVSSLTRLPQLTRPGDVFAYNNAAFGVAGRVIEVVTGSSYSTAVRRLVLGPLGIARTSYFSDKILGPNVAVPHVIVNGKPKAEPALWHMSRNDDPTGGLISSARDQLLWARFQLGDGRAPDGARLLTKRSLLEMRSHPGPGGTLIVELEGMGVTWMLRPSAEGPRIVQHGGSGPGQLSGFMMVPERGFALTMLTNSDGAQRLRNELFSDDWALRRFAGVTNLTAIPRHVPPAGLAPYAGRYTAWQIDEAGAAQEIVIELRGHQGQLRGTLTTQGGTADLREAFYRRDYVLDLYPDGQPVGTRSDFLRGPDGQVAWWRHGGRLYRRQR